MNIYRNWFLASRPWSFSMSAISVSVGTALASRDGSFLWSYYLLTLLGMIILHAATNLMNDYYDVRSGVDYQETSTAQYRPHPLLEDKLESGQVKICAGILYVIAALIGIYLAAARGWAVLWLGVIGLFSSVTYTAPPFKYKYKALGEFSVFLMWGPLVVEGAYYIQRQSFSLDAFWVSLPFGTLVALVLLINNTRDIYHDGRKGIVTLPILIGRQNGLRLYVTLMVLVYLSILWMSFWGPLDAWALIVFFSLPLAVRLLKQMKINIPTDADAQTAKLDTIFGLMLLISLLPGGYS
jgi:1,4-dihydroxy-2-naphthoate octaprenyltransferase